MGRLGGRCRGGARALRRGRHVPGAGAAQPRGHRRVLRGLQQRHPLAHLPRRDRAGHVPPPLVAGLPTGERAVRRGGRPRRRARRHRLDPRLPAATGPEHAARPAPRRTDRVVQPHPVPPGRAVRPAPLAHGHPAGSRRRRLPRVPARERRGQLPARLPPPRGAPDPGGHGPRPRSGPERRRAHRAGCRPADLDRLRAPGRAGSLRGRARSGEGDPRVAGRPQGPHAGRGPSRLHQGHPPPAQGVRRTPQGQRDRATRRLPGPGRGPQPRARRGLQGPARPGGAHGGADQRRLLRARLARRALPAPELRPGGDGRHVFGGRRHAGHAPAGRDEPRREGIRHVPLRRAGRPGALGVRGRGRGAEPGLPVQPHDIQGLKNTIVRASRSTPAEQRRRMRALRRRVATHDVQQWAGRFLDALACAPARPQDEPPRADAPQE